LGKNREQSEHFTFVYGLHKYIFNAMKLCAYTLPIARESPFQPRSGTVCSMVIMHGSFDTKAPAAGAMFGLDLRRVLADLRIPSTQPPDQLRSYFRILVVFGI
jgi:hypothetical protein